VPTSGHISPYIEVTNDHFNLPSQPLECKILFIDSNLNMEECDFAKCTVIYRGNYTYIMISDLNTDIITKILDKSKSHIAILKMNAILDLSDIQSQLYFNNNTFIYKFQDNIYYMIKYSKDLSLDISDLAKLLDYFIHSGLYLSLIVKNIDFINLIKILFFSNKTANQYNATPLPNTWIGKAVYGYTIVDKIGEGGNATVFKATLNNNFYAIKIPKIPPPSITQSISIQAFRTFQDISNESSNLISLSNKSPYLVKIYAIYVDVNKIREIYSGDLTVYFSYPPAIVMEYMEGGDVWRIIKDNFLYSTIWGKVVAKIGLEITEALEVIHDNGYAHLDVKPSNFLLSKKVDACTAEELLKLLNSGQLVVKLGDLGSAKKIGQIVDQFTPEYAPPEQFTYSKADPSMDIFSLGASLYALYKGKKGFNPPSQLNASDYEKYYATLSASDNFEKYLLKMTSPNPKDRPNIKEVKKMLQKFAI